jgi:hypothetical protein
MQMGSATVLDRFTIVANVLAIAALVLVIVIAKGGQRRHEAAHSS